MADIIITHPLTTLNVTVTNPLSVNGTTGSVGPTYIRVVTFDPFVVAGPKAVTITPPIVTVTIGIPAPSVTSLAAARGTPTPNLSDLTWVSVEITSGNVLSEFAGMTTSDVIQHTIGAYETVTVQFPYASAPPSWESDTQPGAVAMILLSAGVPIYGGLVLTRNRANDQATLSLVTAEGYCDRRYISTDVVYTNVPQNTIISDLFIQFVAQGAHGGFPVTQRMVNSPLNTPRTITYKNDDDKSVYSALSDLMGLTDGPEWVIEWEWDGLLLRPVLYYGDRIGTPAAAGLLPNATFDMPGCVDDPQMNEDYTSTGGANLVIASATPSNGGTRIDSTPQLAPADRLPTYEYRWQPSDSIAVQSVLNSHAQKAISILGSGTNTYTLTSAYSRAPLLGRDWSIGDDIHIDLSGPAFPTPVSVVGRAIGWQLQMSDTTGTTIAPVIAVPTVGSNT